MIDNYAFNGCSGLTEMHLPSSLKTIGCAIIVNCSSLQHADISEASPLFQTCDNMIFIADGTQLQQQLSDNKKEYVEPETVTSIASSCFRNMTNLQRQTFPASVRRQGQHCRQCCYYQWHS